MFACYKGHEECVRLLLPVDGIDLNAANIDQYTALMIACYNGHDECVRLLLAQNGIDVNATNTDQETTLILALRQKQLRMCSSAVGRRRH